VNTAILAAIPRGSASSSTVEWVKSTNTRQLAGSQYASPAREGVPKNESGYVFALQKVDVVTIAHWTPVSKQALNDVDGLMSFLGAELFDGVRRELIRQILAGDGTGGDMEGLAKTGNTTTLATAVSGEGRIGRIRRTIAKLQSSGFSPDAIMLHPNDWADIELERAEGGSEEFLAGVPRGANPAALWNVPVYAHEYQPEGTLTVGALGQSLTLWTRQEAQLMASDSHADFFIKNAVAMLAEMRAALTVSRPTAIARGDF
jgi:HK97 family phage major capsid protein